jgi:hypothetical protein
MGRHAAGTTAWSWPRIRQLLGVHFVARDSVLAGSQLVVESTMKLPFLSTSIVTTDGRTTLTT